MFILGSYKNNTARCIWNNVFHPGISCFSSQRKRVCVSLCWSSSSMLASSLCCAERFPWLCLSACCFYFLWKLQFVLMSENMLSWLLWICAQKQMKSMMKREHFLPNKKRVRSEKQIYFLTAYVPNVSLQTLGSSRHYLLWITIMGKFNCNFSFESRVEKLSKLNVEDQILKGLQSKPG